MKVLTEAAIRQLWRQHRLKDNYQVEANTILTPSARSFLSDHHIELNGVKEQSTKVEAPLMPVKFDNLTPATAISTSTFFTFQHELKNVGNECLGLMAQFPQCDLLVVRRLFFRLASIAQIDIELEVTVNSYTLPDDLTLNRNDFATLNYWINKLLLGLDRVQINYLKLANEIVQFKATSFSEVYLTLVDELTNWLLKMQNKFLEGGVGNE